jgi:hypothetical protein
VRPAERVVKVVVVAVVILTSTVEDGIGGSVWAELDGIASPAPLGCRYSSVSESKFIVKARRKTPSFAKLGGIFWTI